MTGQLHLDISLGFEAYTLGAAADIPLVGITGLQGDSGCGKTTLLRAIAGLEPDVKGVIRFGDTVWLSDTVNMRPQDRRIGYVFQDTRLFKHLDVAQNLAYGHKRAGAAPAVLQQVIKALDLPDLLTRRVSGLSGGEKQRVAIGRALAMDPQLLLLDEPMSGLDQARKDEILPYVARAVQRMGCPAIYVSHSQRESAMLADQVMQISDGTLSGPQKCETKLPSVVRPATDGGGLVMYVGDTETAMPAQSGQTGDCMIRFDAATALLSLENPGPSTALMTLRVSLTGIEPIEADHLNLTLTCGGARIRFTKSVCECAALGLRVGQDFWLTVQDARAYPF